MALHHLLIRKRIHKNFEEFPHTNKTKRIFDHLIYLAVFVWPIMNIPQLYTVWIEKETAGVNVISWFSFAVVSCLWFVYGILHKEKPIILMNFILILFQLAVAIGVLIY